MKEGLRALRQWSGYPQRASCGGARAGARGAGVSGSFMCWRMRRMAAACVKNASTRRLPPHLAQEKTSTLKTRRSSPAQASLGAR